MKSQLLPEGFRDGLPDLAELEYQINSSFINLMISNGFMIVKPPLVEFESSLFFLTKDSENIDSFRVMDPLTQKIMGIRSDITMQVARIACGSLVENKRPLRLCYTGDILKVKNNNINLSRQFTQIGAEIIGVDKTFCLSEIINLIIEFLDNLKIKKFIINFSMPNLVNLVSQDFNLKKTDFEILINCYKNKNLTELKNISNDLFKMSEYLLHCIGNIDEKIDLLKKFKFPKNLKSEINNFVSQIKKIKDEFIKYDIIVDPLEIDESSYHKGFCFKIYSENSKELISGGGYSVDNELCAGFSGFLENLILDSQIKKIAKSRILVQHNLEFKKIKSLQKKKKMIVIKSIKKLNKLQLVNEAKNQKCQYYLFENQIFEVK